MFYEPGEINGYDEKKMSRQNFLISQSGMSLLIGFIIAWTDWFTSIFLIVSAALMYIGILRELREIKEKIRKHHPDLN